MKNVLPTEITSEGELLDLDLPEAFWDSIYEWLQDKYGRKAGKYAESYGVEIKITDITWEDL